MCSICGKSVDCWRLHREVGRPPYDSLGPPLPSRRCPHMSWWELVTFVTLDASLWSLESMCSPSWPIGEENLRIQRWRLTLEVLGGSREAWEGAVSPYSGWVTFIWSLQPPRVHALCTYKQIMICACGTKLFVPKSLCSCLLAPKRVFCWRFWWCKIMVKLPST